MKDLRKAFTLVEVMVVVAIIALLATILIPNLLRSRITANESSAQTTLKGISNALETYASTNHAYPTTTTSLLSALPPYLSTDYFTTTYHGYNYSVSLALYSYTITAIPASSSQGINSYSISTSGVLVANP